jgi:hypothetical protein
LDNYAVSRAWLCYAQDPLDDPDHPRRPKLLATIIFVGYPSRAQHYQAEQLEKEGWYDETGWPIPKWTFPTDPNRSDGPQSPMTVGKGVFWAGDAWKKAHEMTLYRGEKSGLTLDSNARSALDPVRKHIFDVNKNLSNYEHFLRIARVEQTRQAVTARRLLHQARKLDDVGDYDQAKPIFESPEAFGPPSAWDSAKATGWKKVLLENPDYAEEDDVQQETYTFQHQYKHTLQELGGPFYKQLVVLNDALGQAAVWPGGVPFGFREPWYTPSIQLHRRLHAQIQGPFDDVKPSGDRFITAENESGARQSLGLYDFRQLSFPAPTPEMKQKAFEKMKRRGTPGDS